MAEVVLSDDQLQSKLLKWKKRLRLQDWEVAISIIRARDMDLDDCQGECHWNIQSKLAWIHILDPVDYEPNKSFPQDMEKTLVHELLHLHFAPFTSDDESEMIDTAHEQAIDLIARALVETDRQTNAE
ncbi:hypothetical protein NIE88_18835 [Sporolactobacillus shoreicorticis]|uniref:Uncharacterized protein n=1 Tax=Sporolactobacillus shoreicorticis TaxID=1923877 RepID=A0ABW5S6W8_9BACL|nr:hypothetical protein [Sporolactobacillus shoreicorticis]MCO7127806.1 hypothetical protein [Sporolactobacillus shoreicorticis]